jgi:hypothetical protein
MFRQLQAAADPTALANVTTSLAISWRGRHRKMMIERSRRFRFPEHLIFVGMSRFNVLSLQNAVDDERGMRLSQPRQCRTRSSAPVASFLAEVAAIVLCVKRISRAFTAEVRRIRLCAGVAAHIQVV